MSTQPAPVVTNSAASTPNPPTHSFPVNFGIHNPVELLKKHGVAGYKPKTISPFKAGPRTLNLYAPIEKGKVIPGKAFLDRGAAIEGETFGIFSLLALVEDQASIPEECRGQVAIVSEDVLLDDDGSECLAYADWNDGLRGCVILHNSGNRI